MLFSQTKPGFVNFFLLFCTSLVLASCSSSDNNNPDQYVPLVISIDPDDDSCLPADTRYTSCADACELEPMNCAADILLHVESEGFVARRALNPGLSNSGEVTDGVEQKPNLQSPMHGLFVPIWNNPRLNNAIIAELGKTLPEMPFVAPDWSISAKLNNAVDPINQNPSELAWSTVMYKIPGYCPERIFPDDPDAACLGGEWFWFLNRGGFLSFDFDPADDSSVPSFGKATDFCLDCHGAVADADWLWLTHDLIRRKQQLANNGFSDGHTPGTTGAALCDEVTALSPQRPADVLFDPGSLSNAEQRNRMFNCYAWKTFVGMFWPASASERGIPDTGRSISDSGPRVWGTYKQTYEVFQPGDPDWTLDDKQWNDPQPLPEVCRGALETAGLSTETPTFQILNETHQAFGSQFNNLVDQNNNIVHYNVRVNRDEFESIKANGYADTGAYDFNGPLGIDKMEFQMPDNTVGATGEGATEVKSAWKILCTDPQTCNQVDDPARYYTETALIYTPPEAKVINALDPSIVPQQTITKPATCEVADVGLVGFHIGVKTFWAPQWIWPTFEHIDNVPGNTSSDEPAPTQFSFHNASCANVNLKQCVQQRPGVVPQSLVDYPELACCTNQMQITNASGDPAAFESDLIGLVPPQLVPIQVDRLNVIGQNNPNQISVQELNALFRGLLKAEGSPLQNYILVNTQWPANGRSSTTANPPHIVHTRLCLEDDKPAQCFTLAPNNLRLRNSVIETYDMAYCQPTDENISNDGGPECIASDVSENPHQYSSGGCMNCHFSSGTDSSFIWADGIEEQIPLRF
tara:strand:+ start:710 stop:3130 length:2421 start_codon:yes stop_codon:yes gene_type:complete